MAFNQRGSGQRALRRDRGDRGGTYGALHATARPDRNHQGPHQLPLVASGGMTLKNSSAGFGITPGFSWFMTDYLDFRSKVVTSLPSLEIRVNPRRGGFALRKKRQDVPSAAHVH